MQFEVDSKVPRDLRRVRVRTKRNREVRFQARDRNGLAILDLQALGSMWLNGDDARAEDRAALGFFRAALSHLQQSGINRLLFELGVNVFCPLALEHDRWNAR